MEATKRSTALARCTGGLSTMQNTGPPPRWARRQGCCKVLIHAPDLLKRARRSARSEGRQRSWRRQADHHIALTSEHRRLAKQVVRPIDGSGWSDSACCLPSPQVRPGNADFAMALALDG